MSLKVVHLSFSSSGGAGTVAKRLSQIQTQRGHDSQLVSVIPGSLRQNPLASPKATVLASLDSFVAKQADFEAPISLFRDFAATSPPSAIHDADIVHIHWINGFLDFESIRAMAQQSRLVWTLHDMNPFTGGCHYSLGCSNYRNSCTECPAVKRIFRNSVKEVHKRKNQGLDGTQIKFVSPSYWLASEAKRSSILGQADIDVIPNPLPPLASERLDRQSARERLGLPPTVKSVFLTSAASLSDPLKGISGVLDSFRRAFGDSQEVCLLVEGRGRIAEYSNVKLLGFVDQDIHQLALSASDFLVVASIEENQPLVISEAQAAGVSLIARKSSGLPEHLDIDPTGRLFDSKKPLADVFSETTTEFVSDAERSALSRRAQDKFNPEKIAIAYENLYRTL
jgi:glycosyltransferase involved in cell wall biosynthesis